MQLPANPVEKIAFRDRRRARRDGRPTVAYVPRLRGIPHRDAFSAMVRTTLGSGDAQAPMIQLARNVLITFIAGPCSKVMTANSEPNLIAGQLIGMATMRYVVRVEPLIFANASIERGCTPICAAEMQQLIDGTQAENGYRVSPALLACANHLDLSSVALPWSGFRPASTEGLPCSRRASRRTCPACRRDAGPELVPHPRPPAPRSG